MGVPLTPIVVKQTLSLGALRGASLAVDGPAELYQFLALIRLPDGTLLRDSKGRITSHLSGLFYRTTRFIADYGLRLVFVFDGTPPALKAAEIAHRRAVRQRYEEEHAAALAAGDLASAYSKATMTSRLTRDMVREARELLRLLGIPIVDAPSEAEAQAAQMAAADVVWAAASKDYDALLFGAPRVVRFLTISGKEFLPSQGTSRPIVPELIELDRMLSELGITREQLVDIAILVGTDFNEGVPGIGPKRALKLVRAFSRIEQMPAEIRAAAGEEVDAIRQLYLAPNVREQHDIRAADPDVPGIVAFLCDERGFSRDRVAAALDRAFGQRTLSLD
jgi:flap endonuclease-1